MLTKGAPPRIGDVGRTFAGVSLRFRAARPSRVLRVGYLDSLEACVRATDCRWCATVLELLACDRSCPECGAAPFRRRCRDIAPCRLDDARGVGLAVAMSQGSSGVEGGDRG